MENVSIIIVNWNGKAFIEDCLKGIKRQAYKPQLTILVDNCSDDGSLELVKMKYPEVVLAPA